MLADVQIRSQTQVVYGFSVTEDRHSLQCSDADSDKERGVCIASPGADFDIVEVELSRSDLFLLSTPLQFFFLFFSDLALLNLCCRIG